MSESTTPAQCRDEDWTLARDCGLMGATPGTNAWDAALGRFADGVRAAPAHIADVRHMVPSAAPAALTDSTVAEVMADCEAFEAAMVEAGYNRPALGRHLGMYRYQRDQDRFVGWKLARALLAAQPAADASEPAGWKLVPVKSTPEIQSAISSALFDQQVGHDLIGKLDMADIYAAIIDEAPAAPAPAPSAQAWWNTCHYQTLFNAIAAATTGEAKGTVGISVIAFRKTMDVAQQSATPAEPAPADRQGVALSDATKFYTGGCFIRFVELPDGVKMEHVDGDTWRVFLSRASSSRAEVGSHPDTARLNWLMRVVNCDEIDGIELPFGGTLEQHFERFRSAIDAQLAAAEAPNGEGS